MKTIVSEMLALATRKSRLPRQLAPFVRFMVFLLGVVVAYGWLFHLIMAWEGQDHSWFTGVYWALTVMSTLGFGDITFESDLGRIFSTFVLLTGVILLLIILPFLFIRYLYAPWLDQRSRRRLEALRSVPVEVTDHVLISANDPLAAGLIRELDLAGVPAYVIEPDADRAMIMEDEGLPVVTGDVDALETYRAAGADRARLVLANSSDTVNSNIILTVRELSETVVIAAVAESQDSIDVLELSGASHVLPLKHRLGEHLANRVSAGVERANVIGRLQDLLIAEFPIRNTPLQGRTLRDISLQEFTGVRVVGVWEGGRLQPARPDHRLTALCVPVAMGTQEQIQALNEVLVIYDANPNPVLILGGGKVGRAAARALKQRKIPVHIVERDPGLEPSIAHIPDRLFIGDAADRQVLDRAGIAEAPTVLLTTHDDAMNVYLTVYCRRLNPEAHILTRVTHERNIEAIQRAGADFVLSLSSFGVQTVLSIVRGRHAVQLGEGLSLFFVPVPDSLAGKALAQGDIEARTGLNVIALKRDDDLVTELAPGRRLESDCELVALGSADQVDLFRTVFP
jgi:Trk K+ transport system NAD-binding subunit